MAENEAVYQEGKFQIISMMPDVCHTPTPSGDVPVPYPVTITLDAPNKISQNVFIRGKPAYTFDSDSVSTKGSEAGSGGGIISGTQGGKAKAIAGSQSVFINGYAMMRPGDEFTMNDENTIGMLVANPQPLAQTEAAKNNAVVLPLAAASLNSYQQAADLCMQPVAWADAAAIAPNGSAWPMASAWNQQANAFLQACGLPVREGATSSLSIEPQSQHAPWQQQSVKQGIAINATHTMYPLGNPLRDGIAIQRRADERTSLLIPQAFDRQQQQYRALIVDNQLPQWYLVTADQQMEVLQQSARTLMQLSGASQSCADDAVQGIAQLMDPAKQVQSATPTTAPAVTFDAQGEMIWQHSHRIKLLGRRLHDGLIITRLHEGKGRYIVPQPYDHHRHLHRILITNHKHIGLDLLAGKDFNKVFIQGLSRAMQATGAQADQSAALAACILSHQII